MAVIVDVDSDGEIHEDQQDNAVTIGFVGLVRRRRRVGLDFPRAA